MNKQLPPNYSQDKGLALQRVRKTTKRRVDAQDDWVEAIRDAAAAGVSLRKIGELAGVSHVRVLQITRE